MPESLTSTVAGAQKFISARLGEVSAGRPTRPRERQESVERLAGAVMRHMSAVREVLLAEARRRVSRQDAAALDHACNELEHDLWNLDARMRGSAQGPRMPWSRLWESVTAQLELVMAQERDIVSRLAELLSPEEADRLVGRVRRAEARAPTRPHPYLPHHGIPGWVMRGVVSRTDPIWDVVTGRVTTSQSPSGAQTIGRV